MARMGQTRHVWARDLLARLSLPGTLQNALSLVAQCQAEGGSAKFNPLNCTVKAPGSSDYNDVPVQNYTSYQQGLSVTAGMMRQENMHLLYGSLKAGTSAEAYWHALAASPWGTRPPGGYTVAAWLADVQNHWFARSMILISGT